MSCHVCHREARHVEDDALRTRALAPRRAAEEVARVTLTAVSTGGFSSMRHVSIRKTVYRSKLGSACSPCLCNLTLTMQTGRPSLSTPCTKLLPILAWA